MAEDDGEYEIVPHREIIGLKNELQNLKGGSKDSTISFHASMDNLQLSMNSLIDIFREASRSMKTDEDHQGEVLQKIDDVTQKLADVMSQNEKIAEGIVAVADMVKELKGSPKHEVGGPKMVHSPRPGPPPMGAPMPPPTGMPPPGPMGPPMPAPMGPPPSVAPPPPGTMSASPAPPPKKGLF
tara:strand:- start:7651 stop:8199 length:549 start_codon:yes stop_codon:yes gene_type:complete